jgi:hypothetical protein
MSAMKRPDIAKPPYHPRPQAPIEGLSPQQPLESKLGQYIVDAPGGLSRLNEAIALAEALWAAYLAVRRHS